MVLPVAGAAVGAARTARVAAKGARTAGSAVRAARTSATNTARTVPGSGIRNAEVRYQDRVDNLSTPAHIRARTRMRDGTGKRVQDQLDMDGRPRGRREQLSQTRFRREVERVFEDGDLSYDPQDIEETLEGKVPEEPPFPFFILILAIIKDVLDALTLTGFGYAISLLTSILIGTIIFIWVLSRGKAPWKKKQLRKSIRRFIIANLADLVPILNILPIETIFVLMVHGDDKRITSSMREAFGQLQKFKRFAQR